ncbi:unnamed protein product [Bursaphelenchus okinawaensis]|uniref:Uncharacterized protein n=1 Tax=Bursaphelenchus okinawaensis TaxID=465554 RepID=A0A811LL13_9BILA|nr:unnamed protein product [Bursaphelenchus okinawaensis]CAG9125028.1 unnamed protein product [Bursaphelenchus okinawaensis]
MIFTEEANYFNKQTDNSVWKPPQDMSNGSGPPNASKLNTWAGKQRHKDNSLGSGSFNGTDDEKGWSTGNARQTPQDQSKVPWSDGLNSENGIENDFLQMNLGPNQMLKMPPPGGQWGREVNQSTPWEVESRGGGFPANEGPAGRFMGGGGVSMDNGTGQWRSWEHEGFQQKEFHPGFPIGGMPNHKMPNNFYGGGQNFMMQQGFGDNRMMRNGPPHMNQQQPGQPWGNKYAGGQRNAPGGGFQQFGGPPQGGHMNMMPPSMMERVMGPPPPPLAQQHHGRGPHHPHGGPPPPPMHPIPPMPAQNPPGGFSVGTFNSHGTSMVNDDSFWHDPNGDLRKWQRDTGTAHWGDPAKQQGMKGQPIRRWTQVDPDDDNLVGSSANNQASPDSLKKDDENHITEMGWGELPPLNGTTTTPTTANPPPQSSAPTTLNSGWMGSAPQGGPSGIMPQAQAPGAGWTDSPRNPLPPNNFMPQGQFPPNNFYGSNLPPSNEWSTRPPGNNMSYGQQQQQPHMFDQPSNNKDIVEKLRVASAKGLIDINMFTQNGPLSSNTVKLLNNMLEVFTEVEELEEMLKVDRKGLVNPMDLRDKRHNLDELREKIINSVGVQLPPPPRQGGLSLADELSNMSTLPAIGGDVAQLW